MGTVSRPPKQGGALTYEGKVAQGFLDMLAAEMDADFLALLTDHNGNLGNENVRVGAAIQRTKIDFTGAEALTDAQIATTAAIQGTKLADAPNGVPTGKLNALAVTRAKLAVGAAVDTPGAVTYGFTQFSSTAETTIATFGAFVCRGTPSRLRLHLDPLNIVEVVPGTTITVTVRFKRDGSTFKTVTLTFDAVNMPLVLPEAWDAPTAASHTYTVTLQLSQNAVILVQSAGGGQAQLHEFA